MGNGKAAVVITLLGLILSSCAGVDPPQPTITQYDSAGRVVAVSQDGDVATERERLAAQKACYDSLKAQVTCTPTMSEATCALLQAQASSNSMVAQLLGKDPCKSTGLFDYKIAVVTEQNKSVRAVSSGVTGGFSTLFKWFFGAKAVEAVSDNHGDKITQTTGGDGSPSVANPRTITEENITGRTIDGDVTQTPGGTVDPVTTPVTTTTPEVVPTDVTTE